MTTDTARLAFAFDGPIPDERTDFGHASDPWPCNRWTLTLAAANDEGFATPSGGFPWTVPYWTGTGIDPSTVTAADALAAVISDAASVASSPDFDDWCDNLGYDTDSRRAHDAWTGCHAARGHLASLLHVSPEDLDDLMLDAWPDNDNEYTATAAQLLGLDAKETTTP